MEIYIVLDKKTNNLHLRESIKNRNGNIEKHIWKLTQEERIVVKNKENRRLYIFMFLMYTIKDEKVIVQNENLLYFDNLIDNIPK